MFKISPIKLNRMSLAKQINFMIDEMDRPYERIQTGKGLTDFYDQNNNLIAEIRKTSEVGGEVVIINGEQGKKIILRAPTMPTYNE